jgi:UDP-N-acetylmuramate dehydrogenase
VLSDGRVKIPAAWLIEQSGFARGYQTGAVGLSAKHPLAIVNRGAAASREIVALAGAIKRRVIDRFGVWLRAEPAFIGFGDDPDVAFLKEVRP